MRPMAMIWTTGLALVLMVAAPATAQEDAAIRTLQSDASKLAKMEACRVLSREGTETAVPALAALLLDAELSHMARYALEPMPYLAAGKALRDALGSAPDSLKVGIISSLATRNDVEAVPAIAALLASDDAMVAQAAAKGLGDIGTPECVSALQSIVGTSGLTPATLTVACDALLHCAETLQDGGDTGAAAGLFEQVRGIAGAPDYVHAAALRGAILTQPMEQSTSLLVDALQGDDAADFDTALRAARELIGEHKPSAAIAETVASLPEDRALRALSVFSRGDDAAGPAILALAGEGTASQRIAAIQALTRIGYEPALERLEEWAAAEDEEIAGAARTALSYFPDDRGDAAIVAMLDNPKPEIRIVGIELVGEGALNDPVPPLMSAAVGDSDGAVRLAALGALQRYAGLEQLQPLLDAFITATNSDEAQAARAVLAAISDREKKMPGGIVIDKAVYGDLPNGPSADVTEQVRILLESGAPSMAVNNANFGEPAPGAVKRLRVEYRENGKPVSRTVLEGDTLKLAAVSAPPAVVDAFCGALERAQGDRKLALIRLLGSTGSEKAFEVVRTVYASGADALKDEAFRTMCEWPTPVALPALMRFVAADSAATVPALRGAVRLLSESNLESETLVTEYAGLMEKAATPEEKMIVLSGVAQMSRPEAFDLALAQIGDPAVKAEAVQTAINIGRTLGSAATDEPSIAEISDLGAWSGDKQYWTIEEGAVVGHRDSEIPTNQFLWCPVPVGDFYLAVDVMLAPNSANAGIQFRSKPLEGGEAQGYQADIGEGYWGRLYEEHGRGQLVWTDTAEKAVKAGEWNRYEILAVGPAIWTAINGTVGVALLDQGEGAARTGQIGLQLHSGPAMTAKYRIVKLVHSPKVALEGVKTEDLIAQLKAPQE